MNNRTTAGLRAMFVLVTVAAIATVGLVSMMFWVAVAVWRFYLWTAQGYCWKWQLPAREERALLMDLPSNVDMDYDDAVEYTRGRPQFGGLPGRKNGAVTEYLAGLHSVRTMEYKLDERLGLGRFKEPLTPDI